MLRRAPNDTRRDLPWPRFAHHVGFHCHAPYGEDMTIATPPIGVDVAPATTTPAARASHPPVAGWSMCAPATRWLAPVRSIYGLPSPATTGRSPPGNRFTV